LLNVDRLQPAAQVELCRQLAAGSPVEYVIATGERALSALLDGGEFHQELAGRLATMAIELVPLWQRAEDIPVLAQRMLERAHRKKPVAGFDAATLQLLTEYRWPGNLNQLQELVSQAGEHVQERLLTPEDLPKKFHDCLIAQRLAPSAERSIDLEKFLQSIERELILRAIGQAKGNKSQAAFLLGLSRAKLLRRIETLELFQEVERCFPGADSSMTENAAQHEASRVESKSASRTDGRSRLRDKLLKSPQPEELASKPDSLERENRNANDDEDRDWVTPDAFEEIE
jgi:DNA-binding NtrC family response regulator